MDEQRKPPVVRLELNAGVFRIPTDEVVFEITVAGQTGLPQIIEKIVEREIAVEQPAAPPPARPEQPVLAPDSFYKEISEEMYQEIGRLARQLSITIKTPLSENDVAQLDLGQAGVDLESAKGHLQDIVQMTEKATMDIMDVSEDIEGNCDIIKKNLSVLKRLQDVAAEGAEPSAHAPDVSGRASPLATIADRLHKLRGLLAGLPLQSSPAPASAAEQTVRVYRFNLDIVFQTLYELCTNETVKKNHIKPMRDAQATAFNVSEILKAFSDLAPTVPVEETFYQFPLVSILKILFQNCSNENFRQTLKKMHQSSTTIFIDQTLPIEGAVENVPTPAEQPAATEEPSPLRLADEAIELLNAATQHPCPAPALAVESHSELITAIESTDAVLQRILADIRRILEALTFQDLSGQRIKKILTVLSNVQVQLLTILVSFGVKLKKKQEAQDITPIETEALASREVDRIKNLVAEQPAGEGEWSGPLNQDAVDKLLADLGF